MLWPLPLKAFFEREIESGQFDQLDFGAVGSSGPVGLTIKPNTQHSPAAEKFLTVVRRYQIPKLACQILQYKFLSPEMV